MRQQLPYLFRAARFTLPTYVTLASGFGNHLIEPGRVQTLQKITRSARNSKPSSEIQQRSPKVVQRRVPHSPDLNDKLNISRWPDRNDWSRSYGQRTSARVGRFPNHDFKRAEAGRIPSFCIG